MKTNKERKYIEMEFFIKVMGIVALALLIIVCTGIARELRAGEREGIINNGYVGEDEDDEA